MQTQSKPISISPAADFERSVAAAIQIFPTGRLLRLAETGQVELRHYHAILCTLFHQTYSGPYTFARAAVNCDWRHAVAKEYLLRHAEEERTHWRWVLDDLRATGYVGPDLRREPPHWSTQAYLGLNYYIAQEVPIARLAIAAVLEGIGAAHGGTYGKKLLQALNLQKSQASFFLSHAETDVVHTAELSEIIAASDLTGDEWRWMNHAAEAAGRFYRGMYDHEGFA
jgi:Iron-containing redox enzyme